MNWLDAVIVVVLALAAFEGWQSGLVQQVIMLVGFAAGLALAGAYGATVGDALPGHAKWAHVAGFVVILALVLIASWFIAGVARKFVQSLWLAGWADRAGGLVLSVIQTAAMIAAI